MSSEMITQINQLINRGIRNPVAIAAILSVPIRSITDYLHL